MGKKVFLMLMVGGISIFASTKIIKAENLEVGEAILTLLKGVSLRGHLVTSVNYNFNEPDNRTNSLRIFDTEANTFKFDLLELVLEKEASSEEVGFRVDLNFGDVAESIGSTGLGTTDDEFDLQQAFISLKSPAGIEGLDLIIGKFVTLLGYEVIESKDNFNTSRSFLFGYAIPFTHTGILGTYAFSDEVEFNLGIVNGWDNADDNNDGKTILGRVGVSPSEDLSLAVTYIYGAEQDNNNGDKRGVVDVVATWNATESLTLGLNYDYGYEEDAVAAGQSGTWSGIAGYLYYKFNDKMGVALRGEVFDDENGARTGTSQQLWEITLTGDYKLYDNFIFRLEYRHDESNKNSFTDKAKNVDTQDTISAEFIYTF